MRYRVQMQGRRNPAFMVTLNAVVIYATHELHWALGHDFSEVNKVLTILNAHWQITSLRTDKPRHSNWLSYDGEDSGAVINTTM